MKWFAKNCELKYEKVCILTGADFREVFPWFSADNVPENGAILTNHGALELNRNKRQIRIITLAVYYFYQFHSFLANQFFKHLLGMQLKGRGRPNPFHG